MYKYANNNLPENFESYFISSGSRHRYILRSVTNQNYEQYHAHGIYGLKMINHSGAKLWNTIPVGIKTEKSLKISISNFKRNRNFEI